MALNDLYTPESRVKVQDILIKAELALSTRGISKEHLTSTFWKMSETNAKNKIMKMDDNELMHHMFVVSPKLHKAFAEALQNQ